MVIFSLDYFLRRATLRLQLVHVYIFAHGTGINVKIFRDIDMMMITNFRNKKFYNEIRLFLKPLETYSIYNFKTSDKNKA